MNKEDLLEAIRSFVLNLGYIPLDLRVRLNHGSYEIHFSIFKKEKVTLADCTRVTIAVRDFLYCFLGNEDFSLDVSSPGAERVLKKTEDFCLFEGRKVKIILKTGKEFVAVLNGVQIENKIINLLNPETGEGMEFLLSDIGKCQLILE